MITIHKGKHRGTPWTIQLIRSSRITKTFTFTESCLYDLPVSEINKLFGYSYDLLNKDSVRIGWKANKNTIQLWTYFHKNWTRSNPKVKLGEFNINEPIKCEIRTEKDITYFVINDKLLYSTKFKKKYWGWKSNIYFGGQTPAPHTMLIEERDENSNKSKE